jgi:hypothetical protein
MKNVVEYILCAAIHYKDGCTYVHQPKNIESGYVVSGRRHHNCFMTRKILNGSIIHMENEQGFITSEDRFVDRAEAYELAIKSGQIQEGDGISRRLISEDLY